MPTLNWIGKEQIINHHHDVPFHVLDHEYSYGQSDSSNKIIHGDNLEALKSLLPEYEGKVKCIYIDPPYNTGNENWVYNDNVNHPKLKKWLGDVVGKEGEDLSRHDKWLCMMYPRLKLLHKLLREDGVIFISIDDNEQAHLKLLLDEIFGSNNFIANVIWQKKYSPQNDAKYLSDSHDFLVCYAKSKQSDGWQRKLLPRTEEQNSRYKNPDNDPRGVWMSDNLSVKTYSEACDYPITTPSGRIVNPPDGRCWTMTQEKFQNLFEDNRVWFGKDGVNTPRLKRFLSEVQDGMVPVTLWLRDEVKDNQEGKQELKRILNDSDTPFDTPKPYQLIQRVLQISTNKDSNDIILDSFAGSGTTAHAVLDLNKQDGGNRKFILVEMEEYADIITAERVKRVIDGYGEGKKAKEGTGGGFDFYTVGDRIFDEAKNLNEKIGLDKIRQYVYFSETKQYIDENIPKDNQYYMGENNNTGYYFYYEPQQMTTLDYDYLATMSHETDSYVIYADTCTLSDEFMLQHNITFKKIPRDISKI